MVDTDRIKQAQKQSGKSVFKEKIDKKNKGFVLPTFGKDGISYKMNVTDELRLDDKSPYSVRKKVKPRWYYHTPFGVPRGINPTKLRILASTWIVQNCISVYQSDIRSMKYDIIAKDPKTAKNKIVMETNENIKERLEEINYDRESVQDIWEKWIKDILEIDAGVFVSHYDPAAYEDIDNTGQRYVPDDVKPGNLMEVTAEDGSLFYKDYYEDGQLMGYWQHSFSGGMPTFFGKQEISYSMFNPSTYSPYGWSKVQQLYDVLISMVASVLNTSEFTSRGALPPGIIELRGADEDEAAAFRDYWRNKVQGSAYKFAIIGSPEDGQIKFIPLNFSIQDITFLEGLEFFWRVVMATFHISPNELGITDTVNKSTSESQERVNRRTQKVPMFTKIERIMNIDIVPNLDKNAHLVKFVWLVEEDVVKEKQRDDIVNQQVAQGRLTMNEARILAGQEPYDLPEADIPLNLLQMMSQSMNQAEGSGFDVSGQLTQIVQDLQEGKSLDFQKKAITEEDIELSGNIDNMVKIQEDAIRISIIESMKLWFSKIKDMVGSFMGRNPNADVNEALLDSVSRMTEPGNTVLIEIQQTLRENLMEVFSNVWNMNPDFTAGDGLFQVVPHDALQYLIAHSLLVSSKLTTDLSMRTKQTLIDGISKGESIPKLGARIEEVLKVSKNRAETIARTETIRAMAEGQHARFEKKGIERWEYYAHLDDRTCKVCKVLHKKTFSIDNKTFMPPRHPRCRCTILAVID